MKKIPTVEEHADSRRRVRTRLEFEDCEIHEAAAQMEPLVSEAGSPMKP